MSELSRRALVASASALPALAIPAATSSAQAAAALPAPASAGSANADPIFARIEQHLQTLRRLDELCSKVEDLEHLIPAERRESHSIQDRGSEIGRNDDPRWKEWNAEYWAASDKKSQLDWSFISNPPTTDAGRRALLSYAKEHERSGYEWPNLIHHFDGERWIESKSLDWKSCLIAKLDLLPTVFDEDIEGYV